MLRLTVGEDDIRTDPSNMATRVARPAAGNWGYTLCSAKQAWRKAVTAQVRGKGLKQ